MKWTTFLGTDPNSISIGYYLVCLEGVGINKPTNFRICYWDGTSFIDTSSNCMYPYSVSSGNSIISSAAVVYYSSITDPVAA